MKRASPRPILLTPFLFLAVACQPQAPDGAPATPPADAPAAAPPAATASAPAEGAAMDVSQPIRALGTEPFWNLAIDGTSFKLERPDKPPLTAAAPGAVIKPGQASWIAKSPEGVQMTVTLRTSECSDGMSDRKYPMAAEVVLLNESLYGCAAKAAETPRAK